MFNFIKNILRKRKQAKIDSFTEDAINKMFKIAGHTTRYKDIVKRKDNWFQKYTMTSENEDEFKKWFVKRIMNIHGITKHFAEREFAMFNLSYGLKLKK